MDKDRGIGFAKVIKGKIKEAVGKAIGDAKIKTEGKLTGSRAKSRTRLEG